MSSAATITLTPADNKVYNILFDNGVSGQVPPSAGSETSPVLGFGQDEFKDLDDFQKAALKLVSKESPTPSSVHDAIQTLVTLARQHPDFAPLHVNIAQLRRLLLGEETQFDASNLETIGEIIADLLTAIKLATPPENTNISSFQTNMLASAHTHLGYILLKAFRAKQDASDIMPPPLCEGGTGRLEEMASYHFTMAGRYGSKVAQTIAVNSNPYAKMCGSIVQEALKQEISR